jgi:nicotinate-nucleotide--dimethylbenzimidazole phosphoribosyltransferase
MKDLDFDELDRAVNSLIGGSSVHATEPEVEQAIDISAAVEQSTSQPVPSITSSPEPARVAAPVAPVAAPQPSAQPLAARRSTGRFMDVVHPSSDMRTATPAQPSQSRVGVTITPPATPTPIVAPVVLPDPVVPTVSAAQDWPDPLDFHGYAEQSPTEKIDAVPVEPIVEPSAVAVEPVETSTPLESPFLSDAKVEKRPLGAFSDEATDTPVEQPIVAADPVAYAPLEPVLPPEPSSIPTPSSTSDTPTDTVPDTILPAELQNDLLTVEADEDTSHQQQPIVESAAPVVASIAQQYTEQPSTGDQPTGAIFDTEAYKKPLAHPKKKKSGWLMVLWIFVLLIIGAGVGAAVYFYVLPQL